MAVTVLRTVQRSQARQAKHAKGNAKGDPVARREADAKALQEKIAKKAAAKAAGGDAAQAGGGNSGGGKAKKK